MREDRYTSHRVTQVRVTKQYRPQMLLRCFGCGSPKTRMGAPWCHWPRKAQFTKLINRLTPHEWGSLHKCPKCGMDNMTRDPYEANGWACLSCGKTLTHNKAKDYAGTIPETRDTRLGT
jgi:predicted RNA-binding Zn-ribbon protein involved in translation (DUF1610 family)